MDNKLKALERKGGRKKLGAGGKGAARKGKGGRKEDRQVFILFYVFFCFSSWNRMTLKREFQKRMADSIYIIRDWDEFFWLMKMGWYAGKEWNTAKETRRDVEGKNSKKPVKKRNLSSKVWTCTIEIRRFRWSYSAKWGQRKRECQSAEVVMKPSQRRERR